MNSPITLWRQLGTLVLLTIFAAPAIFAYPLLEPLKVRFDTNLDVYPQTFAIEVDQTGNVYIGAADGVWIYDGNSWQLLVLPNEDLVRSLTVGAGAGGTGRNTAQIYVGGYDAFGYLERDDKGQAVYVDLTERAQALINGELFADIWDIDATADDVYFGALQHIFQYKPKTGALKAWFYEQKFGPVATFNGNAFAQFRGEGLRKLIDGQWQPVPSTSQLTSRLTDLVATDLGYVVVLPTEGPWYTFDGTSLTEIPGTAEIEDTAYFTSASYIGNGEMAITSQMGDVFIYDLSMDVIEKIPVENSFLSDTAITSTGDLLVVVDHGFVAMPWPSNWRRTNRDSGLADTIGQIRYYDDDRYVLSSGVYHAGPTDEKFTRLPWTNSEAWWMSKMEDHFLLAESYHLKMIREGVVSNVSEEVIYPREILPSVFNPGVVYVGTEGGIVVYEYRDGGYQELYKNLAMRNLRIDTMIEVAPFEVWAGSERSGVQQFTFSEADNPGKHLQMQARQFGEADGLPAMSSETNAFVYDHRGVIIASTPEGVYEWQPASGSFSLHPFNTLHSLFPTNIAYSLAFPKGTNDSSGREQLWAYTYNRLYQFLDGTWQQQNIKGVKGALNTIYFDKHEVILGSLASLTILDPVHQQPALNTTNVRFTAINLVKGEEPAELLSLENIVLPREEHWINFQFALPNFRSPEDVRYRSQLRPLEKVKTAWRSTSQLSYSDLPAGKYDFLVDAKDPNGHVTSTSVQFTIEPRWYEANIARSVFLLVFLFLLYLFTSAISARRSRKIIVERDLLEQKVADRTRALESANAQLDQMAHLDGLTKIPNRRRLDDYLADVWQQCVDRDRDMAVALIDIDHFKRYNDTHGHLEGDQLLVSMAQILSKNLRRAEDLVARYGGEEFIVVLPGADEKTALSVAESMRASVAASKLDVTISAGVASSRPNASMTTESMIKLADDALYKSKDSGRNRVTCASVL